MYACCCISVHVIVIVIVYLHIPSFYQPWWYQAVLFCWKCLSMWCVGNQNMLTRNRYKQVLCISSLSECIISWPIQKCCHFVLLGPLRIPTASAKKDAIDVAYRLFTNERDYPTEGRRAIAERVCLTLMKYCDEVALREFFLDHVGEIMTTVEEKLSKVNHKACESWICYLALPARD